MSNKDKMLADLSAIERRIALDAARREAEAERLWKCAEPSCRRRGTTIISVGKKDTLWCEEHEPEPFAGMPG